MRAQQWSPERRPMASVTSHDHGEEEKEDCGSSFSQSRIPRLSSTGSWRLKLRPSSSHQGDRNGLENKSPAIMDPNKTAHLHH